MTLTAAQARLQTQRNVPPVKSGQVWMRFGEEGSYPYEMRIVCRYPFAKKSDGRMWVIETINAYQRFDRIPELTLRQLYSLSEDVE